MVILGVDVGGSGIKGAPVDTEKGVMLSERFRIPTPGGAEPQAVALVVGEIARNFAWNGPIGVGFPAVIQHGVAKTAANVHKSWIGTHAEDLLAGATGCPVRVLNDADVAGMAEMRFGAGRGRQGVVFIITIGTGLGTALFTNGVLVPNTELGHIEMDGQDAEWQASDAARQRGKMKWTAWAKRFNRYLQRLDALFWPDLFILGGGASKKIDKFRSELDVHAEIVPAKLANEAGIVGAAIAAEALANEH
ncbi:MAG: ROK family protein [Anaerolineae bacterium]|jgi:polyphosphate glucokinase|nr:ROK family protein [Anaerolineae bacterium]